MSAFRAVRAGAAFEGRQGDAGTRRLGPDLVLPGPAAGVAGVVAPLVCAYLGPGRASPGDRALPRGPPAGPRGATGRGRSIKQLRGGSETRRAQSVSRPLCSC